MSTRKPETTQAEPTKARPTDKSGRQLDEFKLPISGPARARELERLGKPDPRTNPEAWGASPAGDQTAE
ncbi:MAG: hypothetical protein QOI38_3126 [Sphingomonadales bacterium]|jgi:hypothetical protein|nr:hypothetical protein [Sphingomonadales bacterium]